MNLSEILLEENNGKRFQCLDNGTTVMNELGLLLFLDKEFTDGTQRWRDCIISRIWVNAIYEKLD